MASGTINIPIANINLYNDVSQLGLSWDSITSTSNIFAAMPSYSIFICQTTNTSGSPGYPLYSEIGESGSVVIFKINSYRGIGFFTTYGSSDTGNDLKIMRTKGNNQVKWSNGIALTFS